MTAGSVNTEGDLQDEIHMDLKEGKDEQGCSAATVLVDSSCTKQPSHEASKDDVQSKRRKVAPATKPVFMVADDACVKEAEAKYQEIIERQNAVLLTGRKAVGVDVHAVRNWDIFYKRNQTNAYRDRRWLLEEFVELQERLQDSASSCSLFEVGCGVGNSLFPLLEDSNGKLDIFAVDCSIRAINMVKAHKLYARGRCHAWQCDITKQAIPTAIKDMDFATFLFVLSAIAPEAMNHAVQAVAKTLRPGGILFLRDYGLYDMAQLRFKASKLHADTNEYVRQDGTRTFFFTTEHVRSLLESCGLEVLRCSYHIKTVPNRSRQLSMRRAWVQASARKPLQTAASQTTMDGLLETPRASDTCSSDGTGGTEDHVKVLDISACSSTDMSTTCHTSDGALHSITNEGSCLGVASNPPCSNATVEQKHAR